MAFIPEDQHRWYRTSAMFIFLFAASMPGEVPPAYVNSNNHVPPAGGAFPQNGYARPAIQPLPLSSNNTTIVVRDHQGCGAGDFTTGVVMGAALSNWGHGWGWGGGLGGYGFGHGGGFYHNDTDVHINNHYDVNNTVINNEVTANTTTNNELTYLHDDYGDLGFDDGDYGMDCGGDFGF
jgi:hypothetical protein